MFTGIIEDVGRIKALEKIDGGLRFAIASDIVTNDLAVGDSISVNGVCLTVVRQEENLFWVEAVGETLEKTSIGQAFEGGFVNLERAMTAIGRFGGHIVQGHVNDAAFISQWHPRGENYYLEIEVAEKWLPYIILEGSITIDGISLTVAVLNGRKVGINIIPYTAKVTHLQHKKVGDIVNIEVDVIAKYVENLLAYGKLKPGAFINEISENI